MHLQTSYCVLGYLSSLFYSFCLSQTALTVWGMCVHAREGRMLHISGECFFILDKHKQVILIFHRCEKEEARIDIVLHDIAIFCCQVSPGY